MTLGDGGGCVSTKERGFTVSLKRFLPADDEEGEDGGDEEA